MKVIFCSIFTFLILSCSKSNPGAPPGPPVTPPSQPGACTANLAVAGTGSPSGTPDWTYDFTQQQALDTRIWTPEVTMSGEGNFEFEAYLNSPGNIAFDPVNGLSIKADLMQKHVLGSGETLANNGNPETQFSLAAVLGCGRSSITESPNNIGDICQGVIGNWSFSTDSIGSNIACTDNGAADGLTYDGCGSGSGYNGGGGIGNGLPKSPATVNTALVAPTSHTPAGTIIAPVTSARISTKSAQKPASGYDVSKGFLYGRIEIVAKIPKGDWLWPAIWMMPLNQTGSIGLTTPLGAGAYGVWPRSGEIDILESRGNTASCSEAYINANGGAFGGVQSYASTLHWGPVYSENAFIKTHTEYYADKGYATPVTATAPTLDQDFHTYGLRWSPQGIYTYIDNDSNHVLEVDFSKRSFYQRGTSASTNCLQKYAKQSGVNTAAGSCQTIANDAGSSAWSDNPWSKVSCNENAAPFDQPFILIMNLAVGGTAGEGTSAYFPDGYCQKPWHNPLGPTDTWSYPVANFFSAINGANSFSGPGYGGWMPSWSAPTLQVKTVKYWTESNAGAFGTLSPNAS
ncbi:MAG: family 16 glycosylhydrolase [Myxococcota bacterium]